MSEMCVVSKEVALAHNRDTEQIGFRTDHEDYNGRGPNVDPTHFNYYRS